MATISATCVSLVAFFSVLVAGNTVARQPCNEETDRLCLSHYKMKEDLKDLKQFVIKQSETIAKQEERIAELSKTQNNLSQLVDVNLDTIRKQKILIAEINDTLQDETHRSTIAGLTFVRWGRTTCPGNGTTTVYSGYAGGSYYSHTGAAANYMCLPTDPLWDKFDDSESLRRQFIYGAEYQISDAFSEKLFKKKIGEHDAPCAVCHSIRSSTMMIPGRNACYDGWTKEYAGYLVAGQHKHEAAGEFVCLDKDPELIIGGSHNVNGKLMYIVEARCGTLNCPPYVDGRELTCVVCTR